MPLVTAQVVCGDVKFTHESGIVPEKALNKPLSAEDIISRMSKFGGTIYEAGEITCEIGDGLIIPAAVLNNLRREIVEEIEKNRLSAGFGE